MHLSSRERYEQHHALPFKGIVFFFRINPENCVFRETLCHMQHGQFYMFLLGCWNMACCMQHGSLASRNFLSRHPPLNIEFLHDGFLLEGVAFGVAFAHRLLEILMDRMFCLAGPIVLSWAESLLLNSLLRVPPR